MASTVDQPDLVGDGIAVPPSGDVFAAHFEPAESGGFLLMGAGASVSFSPTGFVLHSSDGDHAVLIEPTPASDPYGAAQEGVTNYLNRDPSEWRLAVPRFHELAYDLGDGLTLRFHVRTGHLEYDLEAGPGAAVSRFALRGDAQVLPDGSAVLAGQPLDPPVVLQDGSDAQAWFTLEGDRLGLAVSGVDASRPFVIDPKFSTIVGSDSSDIVQDVLSRDGKHYAVGYTFTGPGAAGPADPGDAWAMRQNALGVLEYFTVLGTPGPAAFDLAMAVAYAGNGEVYVAGQKPPAASFPGIGASAVQPVPTDAWIVKLDGTGAIVAGTYGPTGGSSTKGVADMDVDVDGHVHIVIENHVVTYQAGLTAQLHEVDAGAGGIPRALTVLGPDLVAIGGYAARPPDNDDAWLQVVDTNAATPSDVVLYEHFFLGDLVENVYDLAADTRSPGIIYAVGDTQSANFDSDYGAVNLGAEDGWVARIDWQSNDVKWVRVISAPETDSFYAVAIDRNAKPIVAGRTVSNAMPDITGTPYVSGVDITIYKLDPDDGEPQTGTYLGGVLHEQPWSLDVDPADNCVMLGGQTMSGAGSFPNVVLLHTMQSGVDGLLYGPNRCDAIVDPPAPQLSFWHTEVCSGDDMLFVDASLFESPRSPGTYRWEFDDGETELGPQVLHKWETPGYHSVILSIEDNLGRVWYRSETVYVCAPPNNNDETWGGPGGTGPSGATGNGDVDTDRDGVLDYQDNCPYQPNFHQEDSDGDGPGDACDNEHPPEAVPQPPSEVEIPDTDRDGVVDPSDNCVSVDNRMQEDLDGDGKGDVCDDDKDGDRVPEFRPRSPEMNDNCPETANPEQADSDLDTVGDACDPTPAGTAPTNLVPKVSKQRERADDTDGGGSTAALRTGIVFGSFAAALLGVGFLLLGAFGRRKA